MGTSFGFLVTRPDPRRAGDAYGQVLARHLARAGVSTVVAAVGGQRHSSPGTVAVGCPGDAVSVLAGVDVVVVDHEVRGDEDADRVVAEVVEQVQVPVIVVGRRLPSAPDPLQRQMLGRIGAAAQALVVTSAAVGGRLAMAYQMAPGRVSVIHDDIRQPARAAEAFDAAAPIVVTHGLVGPGRGLEAVIDAMAALRALAPLPRYRIVGPTDPTALARTGESYRHSLMARTIDRGVAHMVSVAHARDTFASSATGSAADVLVVARVCVEQVASPLVVRALAVGTPVVAVATQETGCMAAAAGIDRIVRAGDTASLVRVLRHLLTDVELLAAAAQRGQQSRGSTWARIAAQYQDLAEALLTTYRPLAA